MGAIPTIADMLRARAAERPDAVAVRFPERTSPGSPGRWTALTFGALDRQADDLARGLAAAGLRPGDRTLLLLRPSVDFYALVFGLVRLGAVPVFIDPGMGPRSALRCVGQIAPRGLVAIPPVHLVRKILPGPFRAVEVAITAGRPWFWKGPSLEACRRPGEGPYVGPEADPDADAVLVFTSGSTGPAKAVAMSHRCMHARVTHIGDMLDLRPGQTVLETLLVYTVLEVCMGLSVVVPSMDLARPATVDPAAVVDAVRRFDPTVVSASPVVWQRLVRHALPRGIHLPQPRTLLTTAAPIPVALHRQLGQVFAPETQLFTPYGATEAMPVALVGTAEILDGAGELTARGAGTCVGRVAPGVDVRVIRISDAPIPTWTPDLEVEQGTMGEIAVTGDAVTAGYRNSPEGNALAGIADGDRRWHRMGDLGYLDAAGRLWFCGRKGHRLETSTGTVGPVCVEGIFNEHPRVARTALVGLGARGRETPVLCVELEADETFDAQLARELLALAEGTPFAGLVRHVLPHPRFPTDTRHNSKIRREDLHTWAARRLARTPQIGG